MTLRTSLVIAGDSAGATAAVDGAVQGLNDLEQAARRAKAANDQLGEGAVRSTRQAQAGYVNLGRQVQDVAVQLQSGTNLGTIIAQQGGQIADAVQQMGGRFAGLAAFLSGPWGAVLTVATGVLVNFGIELFRSADAGAAAASGWQDARSEADKLIDSLKRLTALQKEGLDLDVTRASIRKNEINDRLTELELTLSKRPKGANGQPMFSYRELQEAQALRQELLGVNAAIGAGTQEIARREALERKRNKDKPDRVKRGPADQTARRAEAAEDTSAKIANIRDQFSDLPSAVEKANKAMRQLDDIASDIERRKLVDGEKIRTEIATAKKAIEDSLNKPFNDFMEKQRESAEIDKLLLQGREDEAAALQEILRLQQAQGPLTEKQVKDVLATVQAERQRAMVLRDQRALIQENLNAVYDLRSALEDSFAGLASGKGLNLGNVIKQIGDSYAKIAGKRIVEALFGDALRMLEDKANGVSPVRAAGERMAVELKKGETAVRDFAQVVAQATAAISGTAAAPGATPGTEGEAGDPEIVVEGRRQSNLLEKMLVELQQAGETVRDSTRLLLDPLAELFDRTFGTQFFSALSQAVSGAMYGYATGGVPGGILGGLKEIKGLPESLTKGLGKALGGAQTGTIVSGVANAIGIKLNKTGSQIGGAIGSFIPIPGGQIIGSVIGGLIGNLFGKTKTGGVSLGLVNGKTGITGTGGNNAQLKSQLTGSAGSINGALQQISQALGGDLGNYSVAIGKRKDEFRVSASGSVSNTTAKKTGADIVYKGKDEAAAIQAALQNAIADGAVQGLSAAVQRALKSSSDIDAAIKEALKVQEVELLIGGLGAQIEKQMKDFERQAAERVRIARQYGFDLVKLEERNAKDRLKLTEKLVEQQVGSLQNLIDELTSGSLFEGSAVDRRKALLSQISTAKAAADAGEEGAADKLAKLLEDLNAVSKEAFGTTGGFASDRTTILDAARDTIAKANQRITDAQKASDPALAETNAALDENNGQNAQIIAILQSVQAQLGAFTDVSGGTSRMLTELARNA